MATPEIAAIDHLVLTVRDLGKSLDFYCEVLGMKRIDFTGADGIARVALGFGRHKINLHLAGDEIIPHAARPVPGSADLCLSSEWPLEAWLDHLAVANVIPESGIVARTGARGPIRSVYLRDPDGNLIELSNPA